MPPFAFKTQMVLASSVIMVRDSLGASAWPRSLSEKLTELGDHRGVVDDVPTDHVLLVRGVGKKIVREAQQVERGCHSDM